MPESIYRGLAQALAKRAAGLRVATELAGGPLNVEGVRIGLGSIGDLGAEADYVRGNDLGQATRLSRGWR